MSNFLTPTFKNNFDSNKVYLKDLFTINKDNELGLDRVIISILKVTYWDDFPEHYHTIEEGRVHPTAVLGFKGVKNIYDADHHLYTTNLDGEYDNITLKLDNDSKKIEKCFNEAYIKVTRHLEVVIKVTRHLEVVIKVTATDKGTFSNTTNTQFLRFKLGGKDPQIEKRNKELHETIAHHEQLAKQLTQYEKFEKDANSALEKTKNLEKKIVQLKKKHKEAIKKLQIAYQRKYEELLLKNLYDQPINIYKQQIHFEDPLDELAYYKMVYKYGLTLKDKEMSQLKKKLSYHLQQIRELENYKKDQISNLVTIDVKTDERTFVNTLLHCMASTTLAFNSNRLNHKSSKIVDLTKTFPNNINLDLYNFTKNLAGPVRANKSFSFPVGTRYIIFYDATYTSESVYNYQESQDVTAYWTYKGKRLAPQKIYQITLEEFQKNISIHDGKGIMFGTQYIDCKDKMAVMGCIKPINQHNFQTTTVLTFLY